MLDSKHRIGKFDRRVYLMQKVSVASTSGGPKYSGYEFINKDYHPYVRWVNKMGSEVVQNDQITHIQQATVSMRYREDIDTTNVIVKDNKMYSILSMTESGETRRRFLDLTVEYLQEYEIT